MNKKKDSKKNSTLFEHFATQSTHFAGSATAFIIAFVVVLLWAITGPAFRFSQTWQIVINTATTIITFLMVFLIQHSQNKDSVSLHLKLDEIISALSKADNYLIDSENLSEEELEVLQKYYKRFGINFRKSDEKNKLVSDDKEENKDEE